MSFFDLYNFRARLVPALIGIAPILISVLVIMPWPSFSWPQSGVMIIVLVVFVVLTDLARRFGKRMEKQLFPSTNGQPFPRRIDIISGLASNSGRPHQVLLRKLLIQLQQTASTLGVVFYSERKYLIVNGRG